MKKVIIFFFLLLAYQSSFAQQSIQKKIQTALIMAENGTVIDLDEGNFTFSSSLSMEDKKNVIIRGKGMNKTILSFKGQTEGAEGLRVSNAENITIENITLQDSKGDLIKTMNVNGITFRNVKVEWTGKPSEKNGGYGLYPVQCQNVLIDSCIAIGASDAGIYVGQSKYIEVKNSQAYHNVAGIEIENSLYASVHDCETYENTGGLLVFDLPDLVQKKGGFCKVFNNYIHDNNFQNFAPKGNIVASVPDGTGILLLASNNVEVFQNRIINNKSIGTGIISYFMTEKPINDKEYYPYPTAVNIHDNEYQRENIRPTGRGRMGLMFRLKLKFGKDVPHIIYDGIIDPKILDAQSNILADRKICIKNNKDQSFVNIDAEHDFKAISRDISKYDCNLEPIKLVANEK
ncbi:MAG: parallel beta-helix domain-containing protein [Bacteroidota bacterium]|jgi:parallel beta-helix repeat protein